jgi:hypothetical protein
VTGTVPAGDLPALGELEALLHRMREAGEIDAAGEGVLRRHFEERAQTLAEDFRQLLQEYETRAERDGADAAQQWLGEASRALGARDREHSQRVLATVVTDPS